MSKSQGGDLFIVDNSDSDWKVRQYLHDWCELASRIDIATGYFEIGALLALDGQWQKLDALRILMGDEVSSGSKKALLAGRAAALDRLNTSIEAHKRTDDFLSGAPAVVDAIRTGQIAAKVYTKGKFHAKGYINHARNPVIGSAALVGSSNFTYPGLTNNIELNIQVKGREVQLLQDWYEQHWNDASDITAELLKTIERHTRDYPPFDIYAKALHEFFRSGRLEPDAWEATRSKMYGVLDNYQKDGYHNLIDIAKVYNGALLCDGVGLGKTFIGLMLIERLALHENKNVLLLVPKSGRDAVWKPELNRYLPELSSGAFSSLEVLTHTDLTATSTDIAARVQAASERAHVVIIDEAHNFRNTGTRGDFAGDTPESGPARGGKLVTGEGKVKPSRYRKLFELIGSKPVFMLTATPVNNELADLRHLIELFSRRRDDYFANHAVAIKNLKSYFNEMKKRLEKATHHPADLTDAQEVKAVLATDKLVSALVVQRSRGYVKESQLIHGGRAVRFPERQDPKLAEYSLKGVYGKLLEMIADAFNKEKPLFSLPMYQPLNYPVIQTVAQDQEELFTINRQTQIVALIRTGFLKRLESSVVAFARSCQRLLIKLLAFVVKNAETASEKRQFDIWTKSHKILVAELRVAHPDLLAVGREPTLLDELEDDEDDLLSQDALDAAEKLSRTEYRVGDMLGETMQDLGLVAQLLDELRGFKPKQDVKLQALLKLLRTDTVLSTHKVIIFSEFADTAEYLRTELQAAGITGVEAVDGSHAARNRTNIIKRFSPYYNDSSSAEAAELGGEIRVLISTDVLSEGLNLQDATRLINYELHWNPVRLMQRIGRVDRRLKPDVEARILADHPDQAPIRGTTSYWNFLPPDELNKLLTLYSRVTKKTLNISRTFGIEGKKLLHPNDDYEALRDFNAAYEQRTKTEELALEYERLVTAHPGLAQRLEALPGRVFSGKANSSSGAHQVFFCYQLPTRLTTVGGYALPAAPLFAPEFVATAEPSSNPEQDPAWSITAGPVRWYLFDIATGIVTDAGGSDGDAPATAKLIRCEPSEPRKVSGDVVSLAVARKAVEKHIANTYLRLTQAPLTAPKPLLKCWMELT